MVICLFLFLREEEEEEEEEEEAPAGGGVGEGGVGERLAVGADGIPVRALEALQVGVGHDILFHIYTQLLMVKPLKLDIPHHTTPYLNIGLCIALLALPGEGRCLLLPHAGALGDTW